MFIGRSHINTSLRSFLLGRRLTRLKTAALLTRPEINIPTNHGLSSRKIKEKDEPRVKTDVSVCVDMMSSVMSLSLKSLKEAGLLFRGVWWLLGKQSFMERSVDQIWRQDLWRPRQKHSEQLVVSGPSRCGDKSWAKKGRNNNTHTHTHPDPNLCLSQTCGTLFFLNSSPVVVLTD